MAKSDEIQTAPSLYDDITLESLGAHLLFGEVDEVTAQNAADFILKSNLYHTDIRPLTMFFNTCGGSCTDGFAVIDLMESSRLPIATVGIGSIASMGVLLLSAGNHGLRTLTSNSEIMAHQFSGYFHGKQHELIATQTAHEMLERRFIRHFLRHTRMTEKQVKSILMAPSDRYLTPDECKKFGLIDRIVDHVEVPKLNRKRITT